MYGIGASFADSVTRSFAAVLVKVMGRVLSVILLKNAGKEKEAESHIEKILDFLYEAKGDGIISKEQFAELMERLALLSRNSSAKFVANVGRDTEKLTVIFGENRIEIDAEMAKTIRSMGKVTLGEAKPYECKVLSINKTNRTISVRLVEESSRIITGQVYDSEFRRKNNTYIRALDSGNIIEITATPMLQGGRVQQLIVRGAREIDWFS